MFRVVVDSISVVRITASFCGCVVENAFVMGVTAAAVESRGKTVIVRTDDGMYRFGGSYERRHPDMTRRLNCIFAVDW